MCSPIAELMVHGGVAGDVVPEAHACPVCGLDGLPLNVVMCGCHWARLPMETRREVYRHMDASDILSGELSSEFLAAVARATLEATEIEREAA